MTWARKPGAWRTGNWFLDTTHLIQRTMFGTTWLGVRRQDESELMKLSVFRILLVVSGVLRVYQQRQIHDRLSPSG